MNSAKSPCSAKEKFVTDIKNPVQYIAYYLPQFHTIPENDKFWGKGFTEWTNVKSAYPLFKGHEQPIVPHEDFGYYSLETTDVMKRQATLAKQNGVGGFMYYYYWFNGKTLLEKPLLNMLKDKEVDIPFCLCWANHNWSKNWDGGNKEIIIAQTYDENTFEKFIDDTSKYLLDERYIRVDGKPMLIIYNPREIPNIKEVAKTWRKYAKEKYGIDLYLVYFQHLEFTAPAEFGFDAALENAPNIRARQRVCTLKNTTRYPKTYLIDYVTNVFQYVLSGNPGYTRFKCAYPKWDNTARMKDKGAVIYLNSSVRLFKKFLVEMTNKTLAEGIPPFVFINAWNEWAEGAYLEPDKKDGYAYLKAVKETKKMTLSELKRNGFSKDEKAKYRKKLLPKVLLFGSLKLPFVSMTRTDDTLTIKVCGIKLIKLSYFSEDYL